MFICCNKNLHIQEGGESLDLNKGFIGSIDDRWAGHWYIRAALADGTIVAREARAEPRARRAKAE